MLATIIHYTHTALPDGTAEAVATVIVSLTSWWLGRKTGPRKDRRHY